MYLSRQFVVRHQVGAGPITKAILGTVLALNQACYPGEGWECSQAGATAFRMSDGLFWGARPPAWKALDWPSSSADARSGTRRILPAQSLWPIAALPDRSQEPL